MSDPETLAIYAEKAADYAALTDRANRKDPRLHRFIAQMPPGGRVLDLGCGPGVSAALMAQAGLIVDAFDPVPQMVAMAAQHDGVNAQQAGFDDVTGRAIYDGIWANFSLLHASRDDMPRHLLRIAEAVKAPGWFHFAVKTGSGSHRDSLGRFYTYYEPDELTGLLAAAGLKVVDETEGCDKGLSGEDAHWIALTAIHA